MTIATESDGDRNQRPRRLLPLIVICILLAAVGFNLWHLYPEVTGGAVAINDSVYHLLLTELAVKALLNGKDVTDPWQGTMSMGFPIFHYYQHLPHVSVALVHVITFEVFPLFDMMRWSTYLLLSIFPLSIYWSLRRFDFDSLTSAMGGLVATLIGTDFADLGAPYFRAYGGLGQTSYIFQGWGLYSQLWAMVALPPAVSIAYQVMRTGRGYFWATLLLSATLMSHLLYGYMAFLTLGALALIPILQLQNLQSVAPTVLMRWKRLTVLLFLVVVVTSYFLVPFFIDREYFNTGVLIKHGIMDSFGHSVILGALAGGNLFDFGRFPSFSILVFSGLAICIFRYRYERYLIPVVIFLFWLLIFFGRPTWGSLIDLLPLSQYMHMHRFIAGVHLGGLFLSAVALSAGWSWALGRSTNRYIYVLAVGALTVLLLAPMFAERRTYLAQNATKIEQSRESLNAERHQLVDLVETVRKLPPGRVFAGAAGGDYWGDGYLVGSTPVNHLLGAEGLDMMSYSFHTYSLPSYVLTKFDETRWEHYDVFNVRYVVAPDYWESPPFVQLLQKFGRHNLYTVETAGYFDFVRSDLSLAGKASNFYYVASGWLSSTLPEMKRYPRVYVDDYYLLPGLIPFSESTNVIPYNPLPGHSPFGSVISEEIGRSSYTADVVVEQESMLLLKATYHPNWEALVNGVKVNTVMLMPGFTGIELSPGTHKVHIEYKSRTVRSVLLCIAPLTLILILLAETRGSAVYAWFSTSIMAREATRKTPKGDSRANRRRRSRRSRG